MAPKKLRPVNWASEDTPHFWQHLTGQWYAVVDADGIHLARRAEAGEPDAGQVQRAGREYYIFATMARHADVDEHGEGALALALRLALALGALDGVPDTALIQSRQGQVRALLKESL